MGTLYYDFELSDSLVKKQLKDQSIQFDEKKVININIVDTDSTVTIPISDLGTVTALYIKTAGALTATINGQAVAVASFLFIDLTALTSLTISTAVTTAFEVEVIVWGT